MQLALKHLNVTELLLRLHETEDLPKHLATAPLPDPRLAAVRAHRYAEGTAHLHAFVAAHTQVRV